MSDEILTIYEAAEYLKVSDKTVRRLINEKSLIASLVGSSWRLKKTDIEAYLQEHTNLSKNVQGQEDTE